MTNIHDLYYVALAADQAYTDALRQLRDAKIAADEAYHQLRDATDALRQLRDAKIAADEAYHQWREAKIAANEAFLWPAVTK